MLAERLLRSLEKRLARKPDELSQYSAFLQEYESCGHMRQAASINEDGIQTVYLPHHPVVKSTSTTTKLRVVFNASAPSSNRTTLNDYQWVGAKLQLDLSTLLTRWRVHRFVYCADIEKMFRQIRIDDRDLDFQRILWRQTPSDSIQEFQLLTVTYGMTSAPFLAMRVLQQLVEDEGHAFPLASSIVRDQVYVDDCLFGAADAVQARQIRDQLIALLRRGGFELRKWASNSPELLADIDANNHGLAGDKLFQPDHSIRILGIAWNPTSDRYQFEVHSEGLPKITKRTVLSVIARLFDPLGWLAPIVIVAKIFMQELWKREMGWDSGLPNDLKPKWLSYYRSLSLLNRLTIPRWIGMDPTVALGELHGFSDASSSAYAAIVYLRVEMYSGEKQISLLASRTKVVPIKQVTIPRLELCGAVLLARFISKFSTIPEFANLPCYCWTDATIVLAWLNQQSSHWQTFVANRVAEIHLLLPKTTWRHVPGPQNPADIASLGVDAVDILDNSLWWRGPDWLSEDPGVWPSNPPDLPEDAPLETRIPAVIKMFNHCAVVVGTDFEVSSRFSSWPSMLRVTAIMLRWSPRWRDNLGMIESCYPKAEELRLAKLRWISLLQSQQFPEELDLLRANEPSSNGMRRLSLSQNLPRGSSIRRLSPILDPDGLLRVGGRLGLSGLDTSTRHPLILRGGHVARLIVLAAHQRCLHGGITLTLSTLRTSFWILQARKIVRSVIFRCVPCARIRADTPTQLMGSLPPCRVIHPGYVFAECGVDYAGPISVYVVRSRGARPRAAYIAIFICMATKAMHLELVSDCTTAAFLAAFNRFCSRCGLPRTMYSDRGTNFQGADKEVRKAFQAALRVDVQARLAADENQWKFIPPGAPHFGELWEAGVKSVKHHFKRILDSRTPTCEELSTLLCRIEACLNSRPIGPLNDDVESLDVLTPAHFLVGRPLTAVPEPTLLDTSSDRFSRWQAIQQMLEQFWRAWSDDYVRSCQHRTKWQHQASSLRVEQIVLLSNQNLPPTKWELGRITRCHPGLDGLTRVVSVRTASSEYTRPTLFMVLKETKGEFGPIVLKNLLKTLNIHLQASKSGKLSSELLQTWLQDIFLPNCGETQSCY